VARGYWSERDESRQTFGARVADDAELREARFLRTGDLGFLRDGELYVCGRIKDMLILHGANHYPQDIEASVERCHPALRGGCGAAFSLEVDGEEHLGIVYEVRSDTRDLGEIVRQIRRCVQQEHGLAVHAVALIGPGALPKSTSGKIARQPTKRAFLEGALPVLLEWKAVRRSPRSPEPAPCCEARI
jgi:acyl-CoA synthetase (AMP-forming)/AMP-acid ligase II